MISTQPMETLLKLEADTLAIVEDLHKPASRAKLGVIKTNMLLSQYKDVLADIAQAKNACKE